MVNEQTRTITRWLQAAAQGDDAALQRLLPRIYDELHLLAERFFRDERIDHTLQPTALIHEAFLRLIAQDGIRWQNRAHFFGYAATVMRRILVNHAKAARRQKRGGGRRDVSLDDALSLATAVDNPDVVALDEALDRLAQVDHRKSRVVALRFFGGMDVAEIAEVVGVSTATVKRDWSFARAWLYDEMTRS
jgi:RNA polymerase sigma-70 factor (ECF subfamily)